ncbi:MAG: nucleotidyltransferase domain-containing protein [Betaproteobacteria bacterium]|nr:nucleotidyltransferase domain-containing protein [Betaproteobacteria bacterium]
MNSAQTDLAIALFGKTRRNVLALLFGQPGKTFYLREIVSWSGTGISQVQKELEQLVGAGLVLRERCANQVHFHANPEASIYEELLGIVTKTFGIADVLREGLAQFKDRVRLAFVYGSIAKGTAHATSDIDVLLVADDLPPSELAVPLAGLSDRLGRKISLVSYSVREFGSMIRGQHHFISAILNGPKIRLIGDEHTLNDLRQEQPRKSRARRSTRR